MLQNLNSDILQIVAGWCSIDTRAVLVNAGIVGGGSSSSNVVRKVQCTDGVKECLLYYYSDGHDPMALTSCYHGSTMCYERVRLSTDSKFRLVWNFHLCQWKRVVDGLNDMHTSFLDFHMSKLTPTEHYFNNQTIFPINATRYWKSFPDGELVLYITVFIVRESRHGDINEETYVW